MSCHAHVVVVFYRVALFLATLCFIAGVLMLFGSMRYPGGIGLIVAAFVVWGSFSMIRGLRRRIFWPAEAVESGVPRLD
jgi:hypothetical protein